MIPKILKRLTSQLEEQGVAKSKALGEATTLLQGYGILKKGTTELTAKGKVRDAMGDRGRAIDRAVKASSGHTADEYKYNRKTNRAILR